MGAAKPLAVARVEAAALQIQVKQDVDPLNARVEAAVIAATLIAKAQATSTTLGQVAEQYITAQRVAWRNTKHALQWTATLATHAALLTDQPVDCVGTAAILRVFVRSWLRRQKPRRGFVPRSIGALLCDRARTAGGPERR